ncbi:RTA1 like protein-domain-containing protein [Boeremia exigua]|uniref:RTA1 like protein-domain-containing protein n=1 Tax=Boeremia exigua TaxID=749465 RepID=UPI001E8E00FF|nr:RTA1 like protein-domain-containing protein [Boeremia exigua]KAH6628961.1 RTA1 like protein-domain-containing protein [Boeremia exigua]
MSDATEFKLYHYKPSLAAAVTFVILFTFVSLRHVQLLFSTRTWCFIPFLIGCLFEAVGYVGRALNARESPDWTLKPYIIQSTLTLLGPTFYAASIYMVLGRLIRLLDAGHHSMIKPKWLTKFFLLGDVLSFLSQGGGGGMLTSAKTESSQKLGNNIILLGLGIQIIFFGFFMVVSVVFHFRITQRPTSTSRSTNAPWRQLLWLLYGGSLLIMVRSMYRMVEYAQGNNGALMQKEMYVYVLDATTMFIVAGVFAIWYPGKMLKEHTKIHDYVDAATELHGYPVVEGSKRKLGV